MPHPKPCASMSCLMSSVLVLHPRKEARSAKEAGIQGVPTFIFGGKFAVSGAQEPKCLAEAMERLATSSDAAE
jgi:predicted DsbA family dithiol-disulfide isomerase